MSKKPCAQCGNEFEGADNKKFCSKECYKLANLARANETSKLKRNKSFLSGEAEDIEYEPTTQQIPKPVNDLKPDALPKKVSFQLPTGLDIYTQHVFDSQKKEIERWEKAFEMENVKRQKAEEKCQALNDQLSELKTNNRIKEIEDGKPSTLQGLGAIVNSESFETHVAPLLGKLFEKLLGPSTPQSTIGLNAPAENGQASASVELANWFNALPKNSQDNFFSMVISLNKIQNPDELNKTLVRILNMFKVPVGGSVLGGAAVNF